MGSIDVATAKALERNRFNALRDQIDPAIASISMAMIIITTLLLPLAQFSGKSRANYNG